MTKFDCNSYNRLLYRRKICVHWFLLTITNSSCFDKDCCLLGWGAVSVSTCLSEEPVNSPFRIEQKAADSSDMLVAVYQISWCHVPNTAMLIVNSVGTSNNILVSVVNSLIPPFLCYSK
jgi:hypothetical protein